MIIHINDFNTTVGSTTLRRLFPKRVRTIYDCHELTPAVYGEWYGSIVASFAGGIEKSLLRFMDEIITISPPIANYLQTMTDKEIPLIWNFPTKRVIPQLTKEESREELGLKQTDFIIAYVGSLRSDVALLELVEAINILHNQSKKLKSNVKFIIVGDGQLMEQLQEKINEYKLDKIVTLTGYIEREKSLIYLKAADVSYVMFTVKGLNTKIGMPWKLFESLVCGTRIIVVDETYAAKLVAKEKAGYILETFSISGIAKCILQAYHDKELTHLNLEKKFIWENQENRLLDIYNRVTSKF